MRRLIMSVVAVLLCCGVALAAEKAAENAGDKAGGKAADKAACPAKKPAKCTINGTVEAVNAAAMKISVKNAKGEVKELVLAADTAISGKKVKTLAEIVVGSTVQVKMVGDVVKSVKVKKLPKPAKVEAGKEAKAEKGKQAEKAEKEKK